MFTQAKILFPQRFPLVNHAKELKHQTLTETSLPSFHSLHKQKYLKGSSGSKHHLGLQIRFS